MSEAVPCRDCGSLTVAEGADPLCFKCQLAASDSSIDDSLCFFDAEPMSAPVALQVPGVVIGDEIGRGGMGVVYRGVQEKLERPVAVKVLPTVAAAHEKALERFLREARTMARLDHPHIVTIHDFGQIEGDFSYSYIVMEFVEGQDLRGATASSPLAPRDACALIALVCDALQYAHDQGVVHRDVKPANVLLGPGGIVKLVDFGLAKLSGTEHVARLTRTHQVMGTPLYMAPEQMGNARDVDHRADVFAVGMMAYELLAGRLPTLNPQPTSSVARVDPRVDRVVMRAIHSDPDQRWQSIGELGAALGKVGKTWRRPTRTGSFIRRLFTPPGDEA